MRIKGSLRFLCNFCLNIFCRHHAVFPRWNAYLISEKPREIQHIIESAGYADIFNASVRCKQKITGMADPQCGTVFAGGESGLVPENTAVSASAEMFHCGKIIDSDFFCEVRMKPAYRTQAAVRGTVFRQRGSGQEYQNF